MKSSSSVFFPCSRGRVLGLPSSRIFLEKEKAHGGCLYYDYSSDMIESPAQNRFGYLSPSAMGAVGRTSVLINMGAPAAIAMTLGHRTRSYHRLFIC